jgi:hypothetical protein
MVARGPRPGVAGRLRASMVIATHGARRRCGNPRLAWLRVGARRVGGPGPHSRPARPADSWSGLESPNGESEPELGESEPDLRARRGQVPLARVGAPRWHRDFDRALTEAGYRHGR